MRKIHIYKYFRFGYNYWRLRYEFEGEPIRKGSDSLETHPERPFLANDDIENKGLLGREIAKKRLSG
jgi:hypothetical protein